VPAFAREYPHSWGHSRQKDRLEGIFSAEPGKYSVESSESVEKVNVTTESETGAGRNESDS